MKLGLAPSPSVHLGDPRKVKHSRRFRAESKEPMREGSKSDSLLSNGSVSFIGQTYAELGSSAEENSQVENRPYSIIDLKYIFPCSRSAVFHKSLPPAMFA